MSKPHYDVLLFDLGGVLVQWNGTEGLLHLTQGQLSKEACRLFWLESPWVRRFESRCCLPDEFAAGAVEELNLDLEPQVFLEAFFSWDTGPQPGAVELLGELRAEYRLACLSNNNELHWPKIRDEFGFGTLFDHCYLSHEIGLIKPDREIFSFVLSDLGLPGETVLFLDDSPECVEAATQEGLHAVCVRGVTEVRSELKRRGILSG